MKGALAAVLAGVLLAACGALKTADYYWQGASGQMDILARAKPIDDVIAASDDAALARRLARVQAIRAYASQELALPDNASFTRYSDLGRPFVVWNVFAAPPLSLDARQWCFPVAGCVSYRGYFREDEARSEADRLAASGDDVHVSGVPAYSTLGYFNDPILSTFVRWPETEVARLMFHELAHQIVYVKDDSVFNESFATAVEEAGIVRWLKAEGSPQLDAQFAMAQHQRALFRGLVRDARTRLQRVYASDATDAEKRLEKTATLAAMKEAYDLAKAGGHGIAGYDRWFAGYASHGPNNASLASVALYTAQVPAFHALLVEEGGNLPRFYARVKELAAMSRVERDAVLARAAASNPAVEISLAH
ncbi:MAG: aminopeptidase [Casimicrobiaceae bacterium]